MKKNKDFFHLQYNKINWKNQEKTKINSLINNYIIDEILSKHTGKGLTIFDIGFGVGFFIEMLAKKLNEDFDHITVEGCEPSEVNYNHFSSKQIKGIDLKTYKSGFLETKTDTTFDYVTAIYVFPHFLSEDLESVAKKINSMLIHNGKFVLAVANEKYLQEKLGDQRDLFIESGEFEWNREKYKEVLHYTEIPEIGTLVDYNREEKFYEDLFSSTGFTLEQKEEINDNGFISSLFVFKKIKYPRPPTN